MEGRKDGERERETERGGKRDIIRDYEAATIELTTGRGREREGERERDVGLSITRNCLQ